MGAAGLSSRDIIGRFFRKLEEKQKASWVDLVAMPFPSDKESETYKWLGQVPMLRQMLGGIHPKGLREQGVTVDNLDFEASIEVLVSELRRDKTGQINIRIDELAARTVAHWNKLLSALIEAGETGVCYDGDYFFGSAHSEGSSGTQVNLLTSSQVAALDISDADVPTAAEMSAAILGVISYMMGYKDDEGEPMNSEATQWLVLCPKGPIWAAALSACNAPMISSSTNILTNQSEFSVRAAVDPRSTETTVFKVFRTDGDVKPLIKQEEVAPTMKAIAEGSEEEVKNGRHIYSVQASRNVGYGYWQHAAHCTLC